MRSYIQTHTGGLATRVFVHINQQQFFIRRTPPPAHISHVSITFIAELTTAPVWTSVPWSQAGLNVFGCDGVSAKLPAGIL